MTTRIRQALAQAFLLIGLACLVWPALANGFNQLKLEQVADLQSQTIQELESDQSPRLSNCRRQAMNYNRLVCDDSCQMQDPYGRMKPGAWELYLDCLNIVGDGVMGRLEIPTLGVQLPIYHTTCEEVLQKGVGHVPVTSLPVGGVPGHCVLSGHSGLPSLRVFDGLDRLKPADRFYLHVLGRRLCYQVYDKETVLPEQTSSLTIKPGQDLCTLVTCTPYGINSHRLLVHARRCPDEPFSGDLDTSESSEAARRSRKLARCLRFAAKSLAILMTAGLVFRYLAPHLSRRRRP